MIGIIDYGMGNIHSVYKALEHMGAEVFVSNDPKEFESCGKIVLPGVGAFDDAVIELEKRGLIQMVRESSLNNKIFLGICLGMQLLFETSEEAVQKKGLGLIPGSVKRFCASNELKVPHMGWNTLKLQNRDCPLFKGIPGDPYVYFCHSYYADPQDKEVVAATCDYGVNFSAIVWKNNFFGVQFHPEKSQATGLKILKNFVEL